MNIYEAHGRLIESHETLAQEYRNLLALVGHIKDGKVDPGDVVLNLDPAVNSWKIQTATEEVDAARDPLAGRISGDGQVPDKAETG